MTEPFPNSHFRPGAGLAIRGRQAEDAAPKALRPQTARRSEPSAAFRWLLEGTGRCHGNKLTGLMDSGPLNPPLIESLLRGLAALLVTPFLLVAALAIGIWLRVQGKTTDW